MIARSTLLWICACVVLADEAGCAGIIEQNRRNEADIKSCDAGSDGHACLRVGRMYRDANANPSRADMTSPYERETALVAFDRACTANIVEGCSEGADMFSTGGGSLYETNHPEVKTRLTERACELGDDPRCLAMAGATLFADPRRGALARRVCDRTITRCVEAAQVMWEADPALALELARRPCTARAATTCSEAARLSFADADRDALLAASCELHTADDCYLLGTRELEDPARADAALEHFRTACKLDHAEACTKVGQLRSKP